MFDFLLFKFSNYLVLKLNNSVLKLFIGLATPAFIAWKLTVSKAIIIARA
jgi:hypothetical protein